MAMGMQHALVVHAMALVFEVKSCLVEGGPRKVRRFRSARYTTTGEAGRRSFAQGQSRCAIRKQEEH